ncbi:hypothetical protein GQ42DRAFT_48692 [Ramicandelaber brevisporus]|nr:hypothetical protein GQ42DRAFT_48692 [Ramicandelaber brevisporus]
MLATPTFTHTANFTRLVMLSLVGPHTKRVTRVAPDFFNRGPGYHSVCMCVQSVCCVWCVSVKVGPCFLRVKCFGEGRRRRQRLTSAAIVTQQPSIHLCLSLSLSSPAFVLESHSPLLRALYLCVHQVSLFFCCCRHTSVSLHSSFHPPIAKSTSVLLCSFGFR